MVALIKLLYGVPITGIGTGVTLSVLILGCAGLAVHFRLRPRDHPRGRPWKRFVGLAVLLLLLTSAWAVNTYFDYLPNLGSLLGRRAADQAAAAVAFHRLPARQVAPMPSHGVVLQVAIPGLTSHFAARDAEVYLPPAWFRRPRPRLPVIELLAGTPGTPEDWTRAGFADLVSDRFAGRNHGQAPILVMPDDNGPGFERDSECVNGRLGQAETYLAVDVPQWADRHLEPADRARRWGIGGLSEGGFCAAELALRHPHQYALFLDFGGLDEPTHTGGPGTLFAGSPAQVHDQVDSYTLRLLLRGPSADRVAGWFEVGSADGGTTRDVLRDAAQSHDLADSVLVIQPGGHHTFRVWRQSFTDSLAWASFRLGLGACTRHALGRVETHPCDAPDTTKPWLDHDRTEAGPLGHRPRHHHSTSGPLEPLCTSCVVSPHPAPPTTTDAAATSRVDGREAGPAPPAGRL